MEITLDDLSRSDIRINEYVKQTVNCKKEFLEKNQEYGMTWLFYRPKSLLKRIENKLKRVRSIQEKGQQHIADTIQSEFDAIYNYCLIGLIVTDMQRQDNLDILPDRVRDSDNLEDLLKVQHEKTFELFKKKDHDYDGAWIEMPISTIVDETLVKVARTKPLIKNKNDIPIVEYKKKLTEILMDIANYSVFASILIRTGADPLD